MSQKKDFSFRVTEHWNRLPEAAESPSLEILKNLLDMGLGNLLLVTLLKQGGSAGVDKLTFRGPFQPNCSAIHWWNIKSSVFACASALPTAVPVVQCDGVPASALKTLTHFKSMQYVGFRHKKMPIPWLVSISVFDLLGWYRFIRNYYTCHENFRKGYVPMS